MRLPRPVSLRARLTLWYAAVLAVLLVVYAVLVFVFQYAVLSRQLYHDEVQDVITAEGLLYFDAKGSLELRQDYYSRPQSHMLVDRLMEVRDLSDHVLYRSPTLRGMALGGPGWPGEGDTDFDGRIARLEDGSHVFLVSHIHSMNGRVMLIRLGYSLVPLRNRMLQFLLLLVIAIPLALLLVSLVGQGIARRALLPLERMVERAEGITASNLSDRLDVANPADELGHLARVFNHLLDRLEQAFSQLQRFTADAAHELRTPLAALRTIGEVALEKDVDAAGYREALGSILEETGRLSDTINALLLLSRAQATHSGSHQTVFRAADLVDEVLELLEVVLEERRIAVIRQDEIAGEAKVQADRSLLRVAILNVLHNAVKFSPNSSTLYVTYARIDGASPPMLRIVVQDQGPGIAAGEHQRVFERFFTIRDSESAAQTGTGLGLSIAQLILHRSGGRIWFDEQCRQGARCILELPLYSNLHVVAQS